MIYTPELINIISNLNLLIKDYEYNLLIVSRKIIRIEAKFEYPTLTQENLTRLSGRNGLKMHSEDII